MYHFSRAAAIIKSSTVAKWLCEKHIEASVLADDSGLEVFALNGEPGIYSARYAGEGCTYDDNNTKLLAALDGVPESERTAKFVTVITLIYPNEKDVPKDALPHGDRYVLVARGECRGHIAKEKKGEGGFGYDPVFIPEGYSSSFAELGTDFKNTISHRAKALEELERLLG